MTVLTRCVAIVLAVAAAGQVAWGHSFPPVRTVVVQVEDCEVAVLVGYRPGSGEPTDALLARLGSTPKSHMIEAAKTLLATQAMTPLTIAVDGRPLVPTSVRAKLALDPRGTRPQVVLLVTFALPARGSQLSITSKDTRTTRISWTDRDSGRVDLEHAPAQGKWYAGMASFLLSLHGPPGDSACARSSISP